MEKSNRNLPFSILFRKAKIIRDEMIIKLQKDEKSQIEKTEIDDMFKDFKKSKKEKVLKDAENKSKIEKNQKRRFTEEGFPIFTEEELKLNNPTSGKTDLCPFDCDCCF